MKEQPENPQVSKLYEELAMLRQSRKVYFVAGILIGMLLMRALEYYL